jgi:hypothetical protein
MRRGGCGIDSLSRFRHGVFRKSIIGQWSVGKKVE